MLPDRSILHMAKIGEKWQDSCETFWVIFNQCEEEDEETGEVQIENLHPFFFDKVYLLDDRNKRPEHSGPGRELVCWPSIHDKIIKAEKFSTRPPSDLRLDFSTTVNKLFEIARRALSHRALKLFLIPRVVDHHGSRKLFCSSWRQKISRIQNRNHRTKKINLGTNWNE